MKTLAQHLEDWDIEEALGDPRFSFKHAIRLQGLFLEQDNVIYDYKGRPYARLGEVKWKSESVIEATIKLVTSVNFVVTTVDIGKLK